MTRLMSIVVMCALLATGANAQSRVPESGLAAEGDGRWPEALQIYHSELRRDPTLTELWLRVADIEARLGHAEESIAALERAATTDPGNAPILSRLSQAYAAAGRATAAVRAIEGALATQPGNEDYLRAHAKLATWAGDYRAAAATYQTLRQRHPEDSDLTLAFARVSVWDGSTDAAASAYREYLNSPLSSPDAWLELARAESWRGNYSAALDALHEYRVLVGETTAYSRELAGTLARAGRPREALRHLDTLLAASPDDYELNVSRTIALAGLRRQGDARSSLMTADTLRPGQAETRAAESVLLSLLASSVGPSTTFYGDSDGLRTFRVTPRADVGFNTDTRLHGGYEYVDLLARSGTGLEQVSGETTATVDHTWGGLTQRLGAVTLGGTIGQAEMESHRMATYSALVRFASSDRFAASMERSSLFAAISPRTAGLGIERLNHRVQVDWSPAFRYHVALDVSHDELSDGNARWEVFVAPRVAVARRQRLNLDLGLLVHQFGARYDFDNGYYDPHRYEYYSVVVSPYWKVSENTGVGMSGGFGGQRDDSSPTFRFGGNASVEATFGIYERWLLKVSGSTTSNRRLDSGAFQGYSGGIVLLRRF
jgi:Flp pilus assembly protein TadD